MRWCVTSDGFEPVTGRIVNGRLMHSAAKKSYSILERTQRSPSTDPHSMVVDNFGAAI